MPKRTADQLLHLLRESARVMQGGVPGHSCRRLVSEFETATLRAFARGVIGRTGRDPTERLVPGTSLREIARWLQRRPRVATEECRVPLRIDRDASIRTLVFPGLYGTVHAMRGLAADFPGWREIVGWNLPILEEGEAVPRGLESHVEEVIRREAGTLRTGMRLECFGYCLGGIVAVEVARRASLAGVDVSGVTVLDAHPSRNLRRLRNRLKVGAHIPRSLRSGRESGPLELGIVRAGVEAVRRARTWPTRRLGVPIKVLRTSGDLFLGDVTGEDWMGSSSSVTYARISEVGHIDVFRGERVRYLVQALKAA